MPPAQNVASFLTRHVNLLDACNTKSDTVNGVQNDKSDEFDINFYEKIEFKSRIRWPDLLVQISLHLVSIYSLYLILTNQVKLYTLLFGKSAFIYKYIPINEI